MIEVSNAIYKAIASKLKEELSDKWYYSGEMGGMNWVFSISCTRCNNEIIPIWWEFYMNDDNGDIVADDFSFERLKECLICEQ